MRKFIALLLALTMLLSLAACGSGAESAPAEGGGSEPETEEEYVEQAAAVNALDAASPIPADTGTLELSTQTFEQTHLILALTADMTAAEDSGGVTVTPGDGIWTIRFQPFERDENLINSVTNYYVSAGVEVFPDRDEAETTLAGYRAQVYSRNIAEGWISEADDMVPAVNIFLYFGSTQVGPWSGMWISLTTNDYENYANIYDVLMLRNVRAVLNNFSLIEGNNGNTLSAGGITVTFPSRWAGHDENWAGPWAAIQEDGNMLGALYFLSSTPADPAEAAGYLGETFTRTYSGREYICAFRSNSLDDDASYSLDLYTEFSGERCLDVRLSLGKADQDTLLAFADSDEFAEVMDTLQIDPAGFVDPDKGVDDSGFVRNNQGILIEYTGSEADIVIPSSVSGMDITGIGDHVFAENTSVTSVTIPETVTYIELCAFENCTNLETVNFPSSLSYIGLNAFAGCGMLKDVSLPDSVTTVGRNAFHAAGTGSFAAGPGVTYGDSCFENSGFESIAIGGQSDISENNMFMDAAAASITLGDGIAAIGEAAFRNTRNLKELVLPDSVATLGDSAFYDCGATKINIPDGVTDIPDYCFFAAACDPLIIPESITHIAANGIYCNVVVLQNNSVELENNAVSAMYLLLPNVYSEDDVHFPLDSAHFWVNQLVMIAMDASMDEMSAFDSYLLDQGLGDITWFGVAPDLLQYDPGDFQFDEWSVTGYTGTGKMVCLPFYHDQAGLPVEIIAHDVFAGSGIASFVIHSNVYEIQSGAFDGCQNLTDIWFTSAIIRLAGEEESRFAADAFAGIPADVTVHIPACLTEEERGSAEAFLKSVGIPNTSSFDYYSLR